MKFRKKLVFCFFIVCLFVSNIIYVTPHTVYATENATNPVSLEDVTVGAADLSQSKETTTRVLNATSLLENGVYYLNNKYCGDYLRMYLSSPTASSGLLSSLGASIQWQITNINNKIAIQPKTDTSNTLQFQHQVPQVQLYNL